MASVIHMIVKVPVRANSASCERSDLMDTIERWMRGQIADLPASGGQKVGRLPQVLCTVNHYLGPQPADLPRVVAIMWVTHFPERLWESLVEFVLGELRRRDL